MKKRLITEHRTIRIIQLVIALALVTLGIYMAGPWYVVDIEATAFGILADDLPMITHGVGVVYSLSGIALIVGLLLHNRKIKRIGQWATLASYTMMFAMRLSTVGFVPFVWVFQLALMLIIAVIVLMDWGD